MADDFKFLHIKGRTEGSSNELSFDVLDAARAGLDDKNKRGLAGWRARRAGARAARGQHSNVQRGARGARGAAAQESSRSGRRGTGVGAGAAGVAGVAGVGGAASMGASLSATPEVARRKRARRASSVRAAVVIVLVFAVAVGAGTYFGYRFYQQRTNFTMQISALMDQLVDVDQKLVNVDILMKDPSGGVKTDQLTTALADIPALSDKLLGIANEAQTRAAEAQNDSETEVFSEVVAAARARLDLLDSAKDALQLFGLLNSQEAKADDAWQSVLAGDQLAREATQLANAAATEEATIAAREKTFEAQEDLTAALDAVKALEESNKGLKLTEWKTYLQTRLKALDFAAETSTALLANNREAATASNSSYNATEKEAAQLAKDLPSSIAQQVHDFYQNDITQCESDYQAVRAHVTSTDANLRSKVPA